MVTTFLDTAAPDGGSLVPAAGPVSNEPLKDMCARLMNRSGTSLLIAMELLEEDVLYAETRNGLSAAWTIGHLGCVMDYFSSWFDGQRLLLDRSFHTVFLDDSRGCARRARETDKKTLILNFRRAQIKALRMLRDFDAKLWQAPPPPGAPDTVLTSGTVWEHLAVHTYWHLGELAGMMSKFYGTYGLHVLPHYFYEGGDEVLDAVAVASDPQARSTRPSIVRTESVAVAPEDVHDVHAAARWNDTVREYPRDSSIHELFEAVVDTHPDRPAVVSGGETLTYRQIDALADQVAASLRREGIEPGEPVALLGRRSLRAPAAIMGILKAGGAYVPVDPATPPARVAGLGLRYAVALDGGAPAVSWPFRIVTEMGRLDPALSRGRATVSRGAGDLAYVMFTSGSTGTPKAVGVTHRGVVRLVRDTDYVTITEDDRVSQVGPLTFDMSVIEIFGALLNGAQLAVAAPDTLTNPTLAREFVRQSNLTVLVLSTGIFHYLSAACPELFAAVGTLLVGGDVLDPSAVATVLTQGPPTRLLNVYGPTENTSLSTVFEVTGIPESGRSIPIGRPIANSTAYVVNAEGELASVGDPGELWVGGDGVAAGYLNDPAATAERFVPDRFGTNPDGRLYRTGDRARWREDGVLEFLGRQDRQVKVRDHRVELDEVELAFTSSPAIAAAAVVVEGEDTRTRVLAAYYEVHPAYAEQEPGRAELRRHLGERLPSYMIPTRFVQMSRLPLGPHGKIDRNRLGGSSVADGTTRPDLRDHVAEQVLNAWKDVLGRTEITPTEDFFDLGGNSLMSAELLAQLERDLGVGRAHHQRLIGRLFVDATPEGMIGEVVDILADAGGRAAGERRTDPDRPTETVVAERPRPASRVTDGIDGA